MARTHFHRWIVRLAVKCDEGRRITEQCMECGETRTGTYPDPVKEGRADS